MPLQHSLIVVPHTDKDIKILFKEHEVYIVYYRIWGRCSKFTTNNSLKKVSGERPHYFSHTFDSCRTGNELSNDTKYVQVRCISRKIDIYEHTTNIERMGK